MAEFDKAYQLLVSLEGGYVNDPHDNGGETYAGITMRSYPGWIGWKIVKKHLPLEHNAIIPELSAMVKEFYRREFWDRIWGDRISSQKIANDIFIFAVNAGVKPSIRLHQGIVKVNPTGNMNKATLDALNNLNDLAA